MWPFSGKHNTRHYHCSVAEGSGPSRAGAGTGRSPILSSDIPGTTAHLSSLLCSTDFSRHLVLCCVSCTQRWTSGNTMPLSTCAHLHTHTHTYSHRHTPIHIHMYIYTNTHTHAHTYTHTQTHTHSHIHTHTCTHIHTYTFVCTHIHRHAHTYTHIHTHT